MGSRADRTRTKHVEDDLGVPVATIHRWSYVGAGSPAIKVGRRGRFDPADVSEWISSNQEAGGLRSDHPLPQP